MVQFIADIDHYKVVIENVKNAKSLLWIGTADIKDLYVKTGLNTEPFLGVLAKLIKQGVDVRLIHAKEPGHAFREDFDKYPVLKKCLNVCFDHGFISRLSLSTANWHVLALPISPVLEWV